MMMMVNSLHSDWIRCERGKHDCDERIIKFKYWPFRRVHEHWWSMAKPNYCSNHDIIALEAYPVLSDESRSLGTEV